MLIKRGFAVVSGGVDLTGLDAELRGIGFDPVTEKPVKALDDQSLTEKQAALGEGDKVSLQTRQAKVPAAPLQLFTSNRVVVGRAEAQANLELDPRWSCKSIFD